MSKKPKQTKTSIFNFHRKKTHDFFLQNCPSSYWLGVDFGRWRDEDDSDDEGPGNFDQDFDFSKLMNQKGGLNNKDGDFDPNNINMDDLDSDDDDIPGVEDAE